MHSFPLFTLSTRWGEFAWVGTIILEGNFMVTGQFSGGQFSSGAIVRRAIFLRGNWPGGNIRGAIIQGTIARGAIFLGGNFPNTLSLNFNFSIVCFSETETWANDINMNKNSSFQLPNYNIILNIRSENQEEEEYASLFMNHFIIR